MSQDENAEGEPKPLPEVPAVEAPALEIEKVGYKRPPKQHQWQPGHCPNRRGRPPKSQNLRTIMRKALLTPVVVTQNGKRKSVAAIEAAVTRLLAESLKGNVRAKTLLFQIAERAGLLADDAAERATERPLSPEEERLIERLRQRYVDPVDAPPAEEPGKKPTASDDEGEGA